MKRENGRQFSSTFKVKKREKKFRVYGTLSVKHRALQTLTRTCVEKIECIYLWLCIQLRKHSERNTNCERKKVDKASSGVAAATCARAAVVVLLLMLMSLIILLAGDATLVFSHFA